jgi:hypothetical protein
MRSASSIAAFVSVSFEDPVLAVVTEHHSMGEPTLELPGTEELTDH